MSVRTRSLLLVALLAVFACKSKPKAPPKAKTAVGEAPAEKPPPPLPALPIPAVQGGHVRGADPAWAAADGYRHTAAEYGEPDWDHVRSYAVVHLALTGRDLARLHASRNEWAECATAYTQAAANVTAVPLTDPAATPVRDVLVAGLARDAALCDALAKGTPPPAPAGGLSAFRARYLALVQRAEKGEDIRADARTLSVELDNAGTTTLVEPAPTAGDPPAAKALWLARTWDDTVDPVVVSDPWGSWTVEERPRQIKGLRGAIDALVAGENHGLEVRPAALLAAEPVRWDTLAFNQVPLLDASIDVAGFAAPRVEPQVDFSTDHAATVTALAARWGKMREGEVPRAVHLALADYKEKTEAERYFGTLQLQNGAIRALARGGHYREALEIVSDQSPPRGMEWFAPDRSAVVLGLQGRLLLLVGDPGAEAKLSAAVAETQSFLAFVAMCEGLDAKAARGTR